MVIKTRKELIEKYVDFFKSKSHKEIPSASLIPENDPTVLFTTAGMHPLVPYLSGQKHPYGKRIVDVQKCVRTGDIEKVGNKTHHTFFEMLGNWSFGDYFKEEAIKWSFEFLTKVLNISKEKLAVSCFSGNDNAFRDLKSAQIWMDLGIKEERIAFLGVDDNWWGPAGESGPCGPDTEIFYWAGKNIAPKRFDTKDNNWIEIWNDVFMEYNKTKDGRYLSLSQKNVDTGMGVERMLSVLNGLSDNYQTTIFRKIIKEIENLSEKSYSGNEKSMRIIADHIRAAVFILADEHEIVPGNIGRGYVLRRLIRRAIRYGRTLGMGKNFLVKISEIVIQEFDDYGELKLNESRIINELEIEENKFVKTLEKGMKKFEKIKKNISGEDAFFLFQSYGFPIEMTLELARERGLSVDLEGFKKASVKHQKLSRDSSAGQFKSGLADSSDRTMKLHTATHLLNEALRRVLGANIRQRGSNINSERLRFDFNFDRKLNDEEIQSIENMVNSIINEGLVVVRSEMALQEALDSGAQGEFGAKYPDVVSVYTIEYTKDDWFSKEICTGPHVNNTREIGHFKIIKETSVAAGIRRIKATIK